MSNIFCKRKNLINEADVEALFVDRLLSHLNYPDEKILRKKSLKSIDIGKGSRKENYKPDYVLLDSADDPIVVIDAKSPTERISDYLYQVSAYALGLNQMYPERNPVLYTILTNGFDFAVYPWDSNQPEFFLTFDDFLPNNESFIELKSKLSYSAFTQAKATKGVFDFHRPTISTLLKVFNDCHNLIWKKEKIDPTDAFYEFAKIMFIKIRADNKIHEIIADGGTPTINDFIFSTNWIDSNHDIEPHPFDKILFRQVQEDLEKQIRQNKKKRVFLKGEGLTLKANTVYEVVKQLENFDLYGIDEDLNGRMFETFLNATVRGKGLGQFFTPRGVVHYMCETTPLYVSTDKSIPLNKRIPFVFDGCCGSGGFLIDAMSQLIREVNNKTNLTDFEKDEYFDELKNNHLYGIDANPKISRIARLNMYLHGDGGSKIYKADSLDKKLESEVGMTEEEEEGLIELRKKIIREGLKFDVILSNPPFSMKYDRSDKNEKKILDQYEKITTPTSSEKTNVLFLERYLDLLKPATGELFTVIDDTVLNGQKSQRYRDFILDNFIIKQIISLPFNTFFSAEANIKTSAIHLRVKRKGEKQGDIFMAITNNIGINDHKKPTPERNNLRIVAKFFDTWQNGESFEDVIIANQSTDEPLSCPLQIFRLSPDDLNRQRLDAFYYSPELRKARKKLLELEKEKKIILKRGADFDILPEISQRDEENYSGRSFKYFEIGDVTVDGTIVKFKEDYFEALPTRARLQVKKNDLVFAKNNSSRGTTVIIPAEFSGQLVTTGFIGIRPQNEDEKYLLWGIMESDFFKMQVYYYAITASQPEIRDNIFREEFLLPIPTSDDVKHQIIDVAKTAERSRTNLTKAVGQSSKLVNSLFV